MLAASLPCLDAASPALTWALGARDAHSSCALASSHGPSVRMPGQGIMLYVSKGKHAADRVLAKRALASNKHLINEVCRQMRAPAMPPWQQEFPRPWGTEPGDPAGPREGWERPGQGLTALLCSWHQLEPRAGSAALLLQAQENVTGQSSGLEMGEKKEAETEAFISTAKVRSFPSSPPYGNWQTQLFNGTSSSQPCL